MLPDTPLLQKDEEGYYYVTYSKEVIRQMSEKMLSDGTYKNIDIMHNFEKVDGVNLVELYIKDSEKGIVPNFIEDVPDGSLIGTFHIVNDALWEEVKNGDFLKGFSLAGRFAMHRKSEDNKFYNIVKKMKKITKMFVRFASVQTDKGILDYAGEEDIKVGDEVFIEDNPAADGEYVLEDETVVIVKDGKVEEIREKELAEVVVAEPEAEVVVAEPEEPVAEPEPVADPNAERIATLEEKISILEGEVSALKEALAKLVEQPQAEPIEEEFEAVSHNKVEVVLPKSYQKSVKLFSKK